jgi:dienelactone hydrolase
MSKTRHAVSHLLATLFLTGLTGASASVSRPAPETEPLPASRGCDDVTSSAAQRLPTVEDAIELWRVSDPNPNPILQDAYGSESSPKLSLDGQRFFIVKMRGRIATNENEAVLELFSRSGHGASSIIACRPLVTLRTSELDPPIVAAKWTGENQITFLGTVGKSVFPAEVSNYGSAIRRVYSVDTNNGSLVVRSPDGVRVESFQANANGDIVYFTSKIPDPEKLDVARNEGYFVSDSMVPDFVLSNWLKNIFQPYGFDLTFVPRNSSSGATLPLEGNFIPGAFGGVGFALSPTGEYGVYEQPVGDVAVPSAWQRYSNSYIVRQLGLVANEHGVPNPYDLSRLTSVNLKTGEFRNVLDAPLVSFSPVTTAWLDRSHVAVCCTMLPVGSGNGAQEASYLSNAAIIVIDLADGSYETLASIGQQEKVAELAWDAVANVLTAKLAKASAGDQGLTRVGSEAWRRTAAGWSTEDTHRSPPMVSESGRALALSPRIDQTFRDPPTINVEMGNGIPPYRGEISPAYHLIKWGKATEYSWSDPANRRWRGIFVYPAGYRSGERYPLVIQTHGFDQNLFLIDSPFQGSEGMSAQALSAAGFAVIQVETMPESGLGGNTDEVAKGVADAWRALVAKLAGDGLVDSTRIGVVGFSATGPYVWYSLVHYPSLFRAAVLSDAGTTGYFQAVQKGRDSLWMNLQAEAYGGYPMSGALKTWAERSPAFNLDKVTAAVRIESNNTYSVLNDWDVHEGLRKFGIPAELEIHPYGFHQLMRPQERLSSELHSVNWFKYWLVGAMSTEFAATDQGKHWTELRARCVGHGEQC